MNSLRDELRYLFSGEGMPYEKVSIMVALVVSILMTVLLGNNFIKDAHVAVIDLDNSRYSREFMDKVNASQYMKITTVVHSPVEPRTLFYRDQNVAVLYFPKDLEKNRYTQSPGSIGVFYDNTNSPQTANVKEALNELIAMENAMAAGGGESTGIALHARSLFNPVDSASNGEVQGFLFFFSSMFFTFATIGMVPRLRLSGQLARIVTEGTPFDLMIRLVPYGVCLLVGMFIGMAVLRIWGDMVFSGHILTFFFLQFFYIFALGLLCLIMGWTAPHPGVAASRMILFIPGGFIFGGPTGPIPMLDPWVKGLSHFFPLTWEFHFVRDVIARGAGLGDILPLLGGFLLYTAAIVGVFWLLFLKEAKRVQTAKENEIALHR